MKGKNAIFFISGLKYWPNAYYSRKIAIKCILILIITHDLSDKNKFISVYKLPN